ncbi:MAG: glycosyltransferase, partial [candidate division Zixibacteria bacterium]
MVSLSIVISVYNQKETLRKAMARLAEQIKNPKDFEVVIADDGSTDGTAEFVKKTRFPIFMKYLQA